MRPQTTVGATGEHDVTRPTTIEVNPQWVVVLGGVDIGRGPDRMDGLDETPDNGGCHWRTRCDSSYHDRSQPAVGRRTGWGRHWPRPRSHGWARRDPRQRWVPLANTM